MDVGLVTLGDWLPDPATGQRVTQRDRLRQIVDLGVHAESCGFSTFHVGEHHFSDYIVSSPAVMLTAIAERTSSLRLSTAVTLLAHHDVVRVAEDHGTLDVLSDGRAELIVGRGVYEDHYRYFTGSWETSQSMLTQGVSLLRELWSSTEVRWSGSIRAGLDGVTVQPRPIQRPHPPIWLSASSSASVDRAVALGCPIVIPTVSTGVDLPARLAAMYRESWRHAGHDPAAGLVGLHVHAYVGEGTSAEARRSWAPYQHGYLEWVLRDVRKRTGALPPPFEVSDRPDAQAVCGDADFVVDELARRLDAIGGVDRLLVQCDQGGLPPAEAEACIERFATLVVPQLS
jgi:alkanesulfonate monooxygenase SsuD/methylene tetrahydromethanopterin reductase-like flavin-dependent oxidoreductase (luciferase family)